RLRADCVRHGRVQPPRRRRDEGGLMNIRTLTALAENPTAEILVSRRPWGEFTQFVCNTPVTVKIITVEPGQRLSLQRHEHRGELWQILDVPIDVTLGSFERTAMPGETVWV